jgi:hypothetical protein
MQCYPHIKEIPFALREKFAEDFICKYFEYDTMDPQGYIHWYGCLLEVFPKKQGRSQI